MTNMLSALKMDDSIEDDKDIIGGFSVLDTDTYKCMIELAYVNITKAGSMSINFHFKTDKEAAPRFNLYITSSDAKGNKNYYLDKNGKKRYLPGFIHANSITFLTLGKDLSDIDTEEKVINLYSYEAKKELPTKANVLVDLIGKVVTLGIEKRIVNVNVKNAEGKYVASGRTREQNEIAKVFNEDGFTKTELKGGEDTPIFIEKWREKHKGEVIDLSTAKDPSAPTEASGGYKAPPTNGAKTDTTPSLFGDD